MNLSKNFSNCDPVGIGRIIDGICIYGTKSYKGRLYYGDSWMGTVKGCNISDEDGFVGELGTPLSCVAINGKEKYRTACLDVAKTDIISSNPKNTSDRFVRGLFGDKIKNQANYENDMIWIYL